MEPVGRVAVAAALDGGDVRHEVVHDDDLSAVLRNAVGSKRVVVHPPVNCKLSRGETRPLSPQILALSPPDWTPTAI